MTETGPATEWILQQNGTKSILVYNYIVFNEPMKQTCKPNKQLDKIIAYSILVMPTRTRTKIMTKGCIGPVN